MIEVSTNSQQYLMWLLHQVDADCNDKKLYFPVLSYIHSIPFKVCELTPETKMDMNRVFDVMSLRGEYSGATGNEYLSYSVPVSILEILVALAIRCERTIMYNTQPGCNNTGKWFWSMVANMGLLLCIDEKGNFNDFKARALCDAFIFHTYPRTGLAGCAFVTNDKHIDFRKMELYYQMNHWLEEMFPQTMSIIAL